MLTVPPSSEKNSFIKFQKKNTLYLFIKLLNSRTPTPRNRRTHYESERCML